MAKEDQKTILIVEDNPGDAEYLRQVLQGSFQIKELHTFEPFKVRQLLPQVDVALVDLYDDRTKAPRGLEVVKEIAQTDKRIPIIVMTSPDKAQVEELAKAIEGGTAQDFFWKHTSAGLVSEAEVILKVKGALARAKNSTAATLASARSLRLMLAIVIVVGLGTLVSRVLGAENVAKGLSLLSILIAAGSSVSIKKFLE